MGNALSIVGQENGVVMHVVESPAGSVTFEFAERERGAKNAAWRYDTPMQCRHDDGLLGPLRAVLVAQSFM
jgi:hypothetical protein